MPILRRPTRPTDRHMGLVYGEDPRPVAHHDGLHAGHTVVSVTSVQAEARLLADGWVRVPAASSALQLPSRPQRLAGLPRDAVVVLPADPANPLDPAVGPGAGGDVVGAAVAADKRPRRG